MAGVNKVILVGNLGADPEARCSTTAAKWSTCASPPRRAGRTATATARSGPSGTMSSIFNENLATRRQELSAQGLQGLSRRPDPDPQVDRPVGQRPLYDRGRAAELPRRAGAARQPRGRRRRPRRVQRGLWRRRFRRRRAARSRSRARSRRRSTPTSTTTFPSRVPVASSASRAPRTGSPAPRSARPLP